MASIIITLGVGELFAARHWWSAVFQRRSRRRDCEDMTAGISYKKVLLYTLLTLVTTPAQASLFSLATSGTISSNTSGDSTIPIGTPWTFELTYDTAAPDLDFELTGSPDPTFGRFTNTSAPPALTFFHYRAGSYEVTLGNPADFGTGSAMDITFTSVNAIDINIHAPGLFPPLAGGAVSFHADFNAFSTAPIFASDGLPTNTGLGPESFDQSTVTLLPSAGVVSGSTLTSFTLTAVPEPSSAALDGVGLLALLVGCGGTAKDSDDLIDEVRGYQEGLRWRRWEDAAARVPPGEREAFLDQRESLEEELSIDDYEITRVKMKSGGKSVKEGAVVLVKYTWHVDSVGVVYDTVVELKRLVVDVRPLDRIGCELSIIRMKEREVLLVRHWALRRFKSKNAVQLLAPGDFVGGDVPLPASQVSDRLCLSQAPLASSQALLDLIADMDLGRQCRIDL